MHQCSHSTIYERYGLCLGAEDGIRPGGLALTEWALSLCGFSPQSRIIDVGCGNGATVARLRSVHRLRAVGIDASLPLVSAAVQRHGSLPTTVGTADKLPFGDEVFEGAFLECTLSLMKSPQEVLAECRRVLRSGGKLVVSDVHIRNTAGADGLDKLPSSSCLRGAATPEEVMERVRDAGFDIELWEDHSRVLRDFAVRVVWSLGSMADFWGLAEDCDCDPEEIEEAVQNARPGYGLLIGTKARL